MIRIWFERKLPAELIDLIPSGAVIVAAGADTPQAPLMNVATAHVAIASSRVRYDDRFLDVAREMRVISRTGIGLDNIDVPALTARGVAVCYAPDGPTISTAEHALALMMAVAKQLKKSERLLRSETRVDFFDQSRTLELSERNLGLVGLGRIGSHLARIAIAIGMNVSAFDPFVAPSRAAELGVRLAESLDLLLGWADVVSLHAPLNSSTRHMINADTLAKMKPGSILINCARGQLVEEQALLAALSRGHLAGGGIDVFEQEPPPANHPLLARDDVVATGHIAAATMAGKRRLWKTAIEQALAVCRGERPPHLVNPDALRSGVTLL